MNSLSYQCCYIINRSICRFNITECLFFVTMFNAQLKYCTKSLLKCLFFKLFLFISFYLLFFCNSHKQKKIKLGWINPAIWYFGTTDLISSILHIEYYSSWKYVYWLRIQYCWFFWQSVSNVHVIHKNTLYSILYIHIWTHS